MLKGSAEEVGVLGVCVRTFTEKERRRRGSAEGEGVLEEGVLKQGVLRVCVRTCTAKGEF